MYFNCILVITNMCRSWFQSFAIFLKLYAFFWVIPRRRSFICRRFGTLCSIFIGGVRRKKDKTSVLIAYDLAEIQTWDFPHTNLHSSYRHHPDTFIHKRMHKVDLIFFENSMHSLSPESKKHTCCVNSVATSFSSSSDQRLKQKRLFQWHATYQYTNNRLYSQTTAGRFLEKKSQMCSKCLRFPFGNHSPQLYRACAKRNRLIVGTHLSPKPKNFNWLFLSLTHIQMSIPLPRSITPQSEVLFPSHRNASITCQQALLSINPLPNTLQPLMDISHHN